MYIKLNKIRKSVSGPLASPFSPSLPQTGNVGQKNESWAKEADPFAP